MKPARLLPIVAGAVLLSLGATGCAATSAPAATVTVTVTASPSPTPTPTLRSAEAAPWDLHAVCAAEAAILTLEQWRRYQTTAGRLSPSQAAAVEQAVAVQYLEMQEFGSPAAAKQEVDALAGASGTLDRPRIDPDSDAVRRARTALSTTCTDSGLAIGIYAQGG